MLIVQYIHDNDVSVADSKVKSVAEEFLDCITFSERKVVQISQVLMIDAIRSVLVEKQIDPSLVVIEVYNEENELVERVSITDSYCLTSWNNIPAVQIDFLKTLCKSGKYAPGNP